MKLLCKVIILFILFAFFMLQTRAQVLSWAVNSGNDQYSHKGTSIAIDPWGCVYTTGYFSDTVDFDPGSGTLKLASDGSYTDLYIQKLDQNGNLMWAKRIGRTDFDQSNGIDVDPLGNVYITGLFGDTVDFNPGPGVNNLISQGSSDVFVLKLDSSGNYIWAKGFGGKRYEYGTAIRVAPSGAVYSIGTFSDTIDLNPSSTVLNFTTNGGDDYYIQKLDSNGNLVWAKTIGGSAGERASDIEIDASENVYVVGGFSDTVDFDPNAGTQQEVSLVLTDAFIQKLDSSGSFQWVKTFSGGRWESINSIHIGNSAIYLTGSFEDTMDFDPGLAVVNKIGNGGSDIFVLKLDLLGQFQWAETLGSWNDESPGGLVADAAGNIYITGSFQGTVDFDPSPAVTNHTSLGCADVFILSLSDSGAYRWSFRVGESFCDNGISITNYGSAIYTIGVFNGSVDFDPNAGTFNLSSTGGEDAFIQKLDSAAILPIRLGDFEVKLKGMDVELNWKTWMEYNNLRFDILHSKDNKTWNTLGTLRAKGNSQGAKYAFLHGAPQNGINYYKLKQIDQNGTISYSKKREITLRPSRLSIYPNPCTGRSWIVTKQSAAKCRIININGKNVTANVAIKREAHDKLCLNTELLDPGIYLVYLGESWVRMVKEN